MLHPYLLGRDVAVAARGGELDSTTGRTRCAYLKRLFQVLV